MMTPSNKQAAIYNQWQTTDDNIIIQAVAGSGKTSTLLEILKRSDKRVLFLAFNKSIQEELEEKMKHPDFQNRGKSMTIHSMGLMAIKARYHCEINMNKGFGIFFELLNKNKMLFKGIDQETRSKLMFSMLDLSEIQRIFYQPEFNKILEYPGYNKGSYQQQQECQELISKQLDYLKKIAINMDKIIYDDYPNFELIWYNYLKIREESYDLSKIEVDFTDMLYLPVHKNLQIPIEPYYLFVDEVQDLSLIQCMLVEKLIKQGFVKKTCLVGDSRQSIYGFSGAYGDSFEYFKKFQKSIELPLDINYRCGVSIIDKANEIFNNLIPFKSEKGIVQSIGKIPGTKEEKESYERNNRRYNAVSSIKSDSMIICRNTRPLIELFFELVAQDRSPSLVGKEIMNSIINFVKPYKDLTMGTAMHLAKKTLEQLRHDKLKNESGAIKFYLYEENFKMFKLLYSKIGHSSLHIQDFIKKIQDIFSRETDLKLCTIHKSKGLEADRVYILNEFLIPSVFAKSEQQLQQEENLKYVARTRAKKELYFLDIYFPQFDEDEQEITYKHESDEQDEQEEPRWV